eukprot:6173240-Pleurochrysis_carterae.AAC.11
MPPGARAHSHAVGTRKEARLAIRRARGCRGDMRMLTSAASSAMATADEVRGILIAGETPEVNGVQIHQDKLGEYIRTGGTMNGRPAYFKDNNTNHMLWFAVALDGPTWCEPSPSAHTARHLSRGRRCKPRALALSSEVAPRRAARWCEKASGWKRGRLPQPSTLLCSTAWTLRALYTASARKA